jgi:hypothetical protein
MQFAFSCVPHTYAGIEQTLSAARLGRYLGAANGDRHLAFRLYLWNARLCEAFYLPIQICEVAFRNSAHQALRRHYGNDWHQRGGFLCTLPDRLKTELRNVIAEERRAYGARMTIDHVVSGLSFGFWVHLTSKRYEGVLWPRYLPHCFPNKPGHVQPQTIHARLEGLRIQRNRIAHHKPIFDRRPSQQYGEMLETLGWICTETKWLVKQTSRVQRTINARPRD